MGDRRLYLPDLAVGRLVETPAQIIAQVDEFGPPTAGSTRGRAYVAGYDFMTDGASVGRQALSNR